MAQEAKMCAVSKACMCTFVHSRVWVCACVFVCACTYIHTARYGSFMFLSCCVGETRQLCEFIRACLSLCLNSFIIHKKCVPAAETWVRIATIHAFLKNFVDIGTALWKKSQASFVVFFFIFHHCGHFERTFIQWQQNCGCVRRKEKVMASAFVVLWMALKKISLHPAKKIIKSVCSPCSVNKVVVCKKAKRWTWRQHKVVVFTVWI